MNSSSTVKKNRLALAMLLVVVAAVAILLSLPAFRFNSCVYTKKSPNTFVGDETYQAVSAEVEQVAEELRAGGIEVTVNETVTERTNSKGETTSLVTFTINEEFTKNGWSFLGAGLTSSWVLLGILACLLLSVVCAFLGTLPCMDTSYRFLDSRARMLRSASCLLALAAFLLVPVFFMTNTYTLSRRIAAIHAAHGGS